MTSPCCDLIYGFEFPNELTHKEKRELFDVGLHFSPLIYTLEDTPESYIVGKIISATNDAEQTNNLDVKLQELTEEKKQEIKILLLATLAKMGYPTDVNEKLSLMMNSYYG